MYSGDFNSAQIHITYTDEEVANLQAPFAVYKYVASSDSYVLMPSTVDTAAKMVTVTVASIDDPLVCHRLASDSGSTGGSSFAVGFYLRFPLSLLVLVGRCWRLVL